MYTISYSLQGIFMVKDGKGGAKTLTGLNFEEKENRSGKTFGKDTATA